MGGVVALTGRCLCGELRFQISHVPQHMGVCHCKDCQRRSGSAFSVMAGIPKGQFSLLCGEPKRYRGDTDSDTSAEIGFCSRCGTSIYTRLANQPEMLFVQAGTLDDTSWLEPQFHVWCSQKQRWVDLDGRRDGVTRSTGSGSMK